MAKGQEIDGAVEKCLAQALETSYFMRYNADAMLSKGLLLPYQTGLLPTEGSTIYSNNQVDHPSTSSIRVDTLNSTATFSGHINTTFQIKPEGDNSRIPYSDIIGLKGNHTKQLKALSDCIEAGFPILLVTNDPQRLQQNLSTMAVLQGQTLKRILLNERTDTT